MIVERIRLKEPAARFQFVFGMGIQDRMRAHLLRFICLPGRGRECRDVAAPLVRELQRQVTQPANPDHTDAIGRFDIELNQWIEDSNPTAEQRSGFAEVDALRNRELPRPNDIEHA